MKKLRSAPGSPSSRSDVPIIGRGPKPNPELAAVMEASEALGRRVVLENIGCKVTASGLEIVGASQDLAWLVISVGNKVEEAIGYDLQPGEYVVPENKSEMPVGDRLFAFCDCASLLCVLPKDLTAKMIRQKPILVTAPTSGA